MPNNVVAAAALAILFGVSCGEVDREFGNKLVVDAASRDDGGQSLGTATDASGNPSQPASSAVQGSQCYEYEQDERACAGSAQRSVLLCDDGEWRLQYMCDQGENCDQSRTTCAPIVQDCADKDSGQRFCNGDVLMTCGADLTKVYEEKCDGACEGSASQGFKCTESRCGNGKTGDREQCDGDGGSCVQCQTVAPSSSTTEDPTAPSTDTSAEESTTAAKTDGGVQEPPDASASPDKDADTSDAEADAGDAQVFFPSPLGTACQADVECASARCEATTLGGEVCCAVECPAGLGCSADGTTCVECELAAPYCSDANQLSECSVNQWSTQSCPTGCENSEGLAQCAPLITRGGSCADSTQCEAGTECVEGICCEDGCTGGQVCGGDGACTCPSGQVWIGGLCKLPEGSTCTNGGTPCVGSCEPTEAGDLICCEQVCGTYEVCHSVSNSCVECESRPSAPTCETVEGVEAVVHCVDNSLNTTPCSDGCSAGECLGADGDTCSVNAECGSSNCANSMGTKRCCPATSCALGCNAEGTCYECTGTAQGCSGGDIAVCSNGFWEVTQACNLGCYSVGPKCKLGPGSPCTVGGECASGRCTTHEGSGSIWTLCD